MAMQGLREEKKAWPPIRGSENCSAQTRCMFMGMWGENRVGTVRNEAGEISSEEPALRSILRTLNLILREKDRETF